MPQERVERRERNREHAKRSRIRKRVILDLLQDQLAALRGENVRLRRVVLERLPDKVCASAHPCIHPSAWLNMGFFAFPCRPSDLSFSVPRPGLSLSDAQQRNRGC